MQGKGLIKTFAILLALLSIYQLSFTFAGMRVKKQAHQYANGDFKKEKQYLDSLNKLPVYNLLGMKFTYDEVKKREMNLGLDLQGGINVILQISVKDILKDLANHSHDPDFNRALKMADDAQKSSDKPYLDLFFEAWDKVAKESGKKLSDPRIFGNKKLAGDIEPGMPDSEAKKVIREKVDEAMVSAFEVLRKRIDKFGVTSPNIQRLGKSGRILVELPGAKDAERIKKLLQSTAQLEFWPGYKQEDYLPYIQTVDQIIARKYGNATDSTQAATASLSSLIVKGGYGPVLGYFAIKDTAKVNRYLQDPEVVKARPDNLRFAQFLWGKRDEKADIIPLYVITGNADGIPPLSGDVITDARQSFDRLNKPAVSMTMNAKGAKIWEKMTGEAYKNGSTIAIVLDKVVYSAPTVTNGPISGGRSEITGNFTIEEAKDLANVLRAGKLPAKADIIQSEIVGPTLGKEAIHQSKVAFAFALLLVILWMIFYYGGAGVVAGVVLLINLLYVFGILSSLKLVLTLPGIAGIVLTIGMAVDANVLIYERIREELRSGKNIRAAIADGYKNALSSILDANITTLITGFILFVFGTGPIQGFATTLIIGILASLFTAIFLSRIFIEWWLDKGKRMTFSTKFTENWLVNVDFPFLEKRKLAYMVSGTLIAIGLASIFTQGLNPGVDFVGGRTYTVRFPQAISANEVADELGKVFVENGHQIKPEVKTFGAANQLKITTKYKINATGEEADREVQQKLYEGLKPYLPKGMTYDDFISTKGEKAYGLMQSIKVGPTIADDIKKGAVWAIIFSLLAIFIYILVRFKYWEFSVGAITALVHDVLIVLGVFSLTYKIMPFDMEVDQAFIAAILTVIGYSLNDTVVIFDRIREFFRLHPSWDPKKVINKALGSTLSRTLNTSFTTFLVLLVEFIFGGDSIRGFIFALMIGVIVGTYSSLFVATPVMYDLMKKRFSKIHKGKKK
ncbi:MAG: protein translocase subunit SecDF [Chlorobi bacterium]|nr:protein translocase subunit SecDF [Chlorobiota bacterium]